MIDFCVLDRVPYGNVRHCGRESRPDFGTDPRAVAVLPHVVVRVAAKRRSDSALHIAARYSVLAERDGNKRKPVLAEHFGGNVFRSLALDGMKPYELKIEVVVGKRFFGLGDKAFYVEYFAFSLVRTAYRSADVFTYPARVHFVFVGLSVEFHSRHRL